MSAPKFNLLYFKNVLDAVFIRFFDLYNDSFIAQDGVYIMKDTMSCAKVAKVFKALAVDELKKHLVKYDILDPNYFIIIGACMPQDNILLKLKGKSYFPEKLVKAIDGDFQVKYVLKEKDIKIDRVLFNQACIKVFNGFFTGKDQAERHFGPEFTNVCFVQHKRLDCYSLFKAIKWIYGKANCRNLYVEEFKDKRSPLIAVNDLIDRYVHDKSSLNADPEFKAAVAEVEQFLVQRFGFKRHG